MKKGDVIAWHIGECPRCRRRFMGRLEVHSADHVGIVPPPVISIACQCALPVTMVDLVYSVPEPKE